MTRAAVAQIAAALGMLAGLWWVVSADAVGAVDAVPGLTLAALAIAAGLTPGYRATGALAALAAAMWFAGSWDALQWVHRGAIAWLVLAYPGAKLRPRWSIAVVAAVSASGLVPAFVADPAVTAILATAVPATAAVRLARTSRIGRRPAAAALAAAIVTAGAWILPLVLRSLGAPAPTVLAVYLFGTAYVGLLLLIDVTLGRSPESALVGVVIDLGGITDRGTLRDRLARIVGDPELRLGMRLGDGRYVDDAGLSVPWSEPSPAHVVTPIDDDGRRVAVLVHDAAIRVDPALLPAIAAAVSLALRNVELHADVRARVAEIEDSRDRLLIAENAARGGFTGDLENGPRRRLRRVGELLDRISDLDVTDRLTGAAARADDELRRFGLGLHPAAVEDDDLDGSLERLAEGLPFAVEVHAEVSHLTPEVRSAVWFVCAESLTNVAKHAAASRVSVSVELAAQDVVVVTVRDDGNGGASMTAGTGLTGLRDRVSALRGGLEVESPLGGGTVVRAWLPRVAPPALVMEAG